MEKTTKILKTTNDTYSLTDQELIELLKSNNLIDGEGTIEFDYDDRLKKLFIYVETITEEGNLITYSDDQLIFLESSIADLRNAEKISQPLYKALIANDLRVIKPILLITKKDLMLRKYITKKIVSELDELLKEYSVVLPE